METITSLSRRGILKMAAGALVVRFALGQAAAAMLPNLSIPLKSIVFSPSTPMDRSPSTPAKSMSAQDSPPRFARPRPKNSVSRSSASPSSKATPRLRPITAEPAEVPAFPAARPISVARRPRHARRCSIWAPSNSTSPHRNL